MPCFYFFWNFAWHDSWINSLSHFLVQALPNGISVAMTKKKKPESCLLGIGYISGGSNDVRKTCIPWRMTILSRCADHHGAYLTLRSKQLVTLAQLCMSCKMGANALRTRRPPIEHRKWESSLHRLRGRCLVSQLGSCMPWPIVQWRWQDLVALIVGLQCTRRCPRKAVVLQICAKWYGSSVR